MFSHFHFPTSGSSTLAEKVLEGKVFRHYPVWSLGLHCPHSYKAPSL